MQQIVPRTKWLYDDRGMKKWMGWLLSDHTTYLEDQKQSEKPSETRKEMSIEKISNILNIAWKYHKVISIQLNFLYHGKYVSELIGCIQGFQDGQLFIQESDDELRMIHVEDIRNVALEDATKWWEK